MIVITGRSKNFVDSGFFVDYSPEEFPIGTSFKIDNHVIILKKIFDQFGNSLDYIPKGWKTICQFDFDIIPDGIKNLPLFKGWTYNPDSIKLEKI